MPYFLSLYGAWKYLFSYVLRKEVYKRLVHIKGQLRCKKCGKELKVGDYVKGHRNSGTSKLYHSNCYENLFIEIDD